MSAIVASRGPVSAITRTRTLFAVLASIVVFDAAFLHAPFLAALAVPFAVATWRYRQGRAAATIGLALWCAIYVAIGASFAVSNGFHAPLETGSVGPREMINPGDFAFVYLGTPIALWLTIRLGRRLVGRRGTSLAGVPA
ncbi:MAG: hypothetical protein QOE80_438 [Actinomycetota bacterium]|jgi:hypothetical protein|nr:hypothetical protein [Actinomycetota bacterium]